MSITIIHNVFSSLIQMGPAVVRKSLTDLYPPMANRKQFRWIHQRIRSMENIWVEAGRSLSAKYNLTERKAKKVMYTSTLLLLEH